ncbi:hypothetical protein ANCCEY_07129 [Ancylostoma ceylanicum]|uniref:Uncharacterized protein n=1 Tax=Ancylostoma ceylanicum TaxID=53326 RepID=A0A0D6M1P3_9BILA|nr:hypothetical protein ANCCEY_07129 [Ancylostoma ceylanicum]
MDSGEKDNEKVLRGCAVAIEIPPMATALRVTNGYSDRSSWANTIEKRTLLYGRVDGMAYEIAFKEGLPYDCTCPVCDQWLRGIYGSGQGNPVKKNSTLRKKVLEADVDLREWPFKYLRYQGARESDTVTHV